MSIHARSYTTQLSDSLHQTSITPANTSWILSPIMPSLGGKVCLVTGATRGIGRGIALQLGEAGATVYITGRTLKSKPGQLGSSLEETAKEIEDRGGRCIPVQCDHSKDEDVHNLFKKIKEDQNGQLDVLVNNAYSAVTQILNSINVPFWETPATMWDDVNNVGLRNHYICSHYAANMMVPRKSGLIVNISSAGGLQYFLNVAYGVGKEACDRLAVDMGIELRRQNVAAVSLWPGAVQTEIVIDKLDKTKQSVKPEMRQVFEEGAETPEYAGKCIVHLAADPNIMKKTSKVLFTGDLGEEYGFVDINGKTPAHQRSLVYVLRMLKWRHLAAWIPRWVKIPKVFVALGGMKF